MEKCWRYFDIIRLMCVALPENESTRLLTTPEDARFFLEAQGFPENKWSGIMKKGFGIPSCSHETRALITIAMGGKPRLLYEVYLEMRALENSGPPEEGENNDQLY